MFAHTLHRGMILIRIHPFFSARAGRGRMNKQASMLLREAQRTWNDQSSLSFRSDLTYDGMLHIRENIKQ